MRKCDIISKEKWRLLINNSITNKIKHTGVVRLVRKDHILDKNINILIIELDSKLREKNISQQLILEH